MLNVDVLSKAGSLAALGVGKVVVVIQKLHPHLDRWVLAALPQVARALEVVLVAEVAASEEALNNEGGMEAAVVVVLVSKEVVASEDKTAMAPLLQMLQRARVGLAAVDFLGVEEDMADHPAHQIATALAVGMIRVVEVAHMMTEAVVVVDIAATNVTGLRVVVLEATWSR
jgi:KaiC/GvpD/RAD55 family RecA-like ATPase